MLIEHITYNYSPSSAYISSPNTRLHCESWDLSQYASISAQAFLHLVYRGCSKTGYNVVCLERSYICSPQSIHKCEKKHGNHNPLYRTRFETRMQHTGVKNRHGAHNLPPFYSIDVSLLSSQAHLRPATVPSIIKASDLDNLIFGAIYPQLLCLTYLGHRSFGLRP